MTKVLLTILHKKMRTKIVVNNRSNYPFTRHLSIFFLILIQTNFYNCSSSGELSVTPFYKLEYQGKIYRIRSISSPDKSISRNEIIGDSFVAVDQNRDGVIDLITIGKADILEVQNIYEHAINFLAKENKLREIDPKIDIFQFTDSGFYYEIRSFKIVNDGYINQIKITADSKFNNQYFILLDENANGKLDKVIKGDIAIEDFQEPYNALIRKGLREKKLIKEDSLIIVKN